MEIESVLIIWLVIMIAVLPSIFLFLKTPPSERYKFKLTRQKSINDQLEELAPEAGPVVIKGKKFKALSNIVPWSLFVIVGGIITLLYLMQNIYDNCFTIYGIHVTVWYLMIFSFGLPLSFVFMSIFFSICGVKNIKTGYFPPLDSIHFRDTISTKGIFSRFRGVLMVLLPLLSLVSVYFGTSSIIN